MNDPLRDALERLRSLIDQTAEQGIADANTMALATVDADGAPSIRTIFVLDIKPPGPAFLINERSGKARQMEQNPRISLCFYSHAVQHQVIIEGFALRLEPDESDHLWQMRGRDAQLGAWASDSSAPPSDPQQRRAHARERAATSSFESVPRPENWQAWRIQSNRIAIWHAGWNRLRSRTRYESDAYGVWEVIEENP